jgi:hypothetical protein
MTVDEQITTLRKYGTVPTSSSTSQATPAKSSATKPAKMPGPGGNAIIPLVELFDVSTRTNSSTAPHGVTFKQADSALAQCLGDLDRRTGDLQRALLHILDGLLARTRIRATLNNLN